MKQPARKIAALILAMSMALSQLAFSAWAAPVAVEPVQTAVDAVQVDLDNVQPDIDRDLYAKAIVMALSDEAESVEIDEENELAMEGIRSELESIVVTADDGSKVALTPAEIGQAMGLYNMYLKQWEDNADVLGVQTPFYLMYNDNNDELGTLGEMLVLAGYSVDDVRNGNYAFGDLMGMIQNFYFGDYFALQFYKDQILAKLDEAMDVLEKSGAKTDVQKMLVLNDWVGHTDSFDMAYIMNSGTAEMNPEKPVKHPAYDTIHEVIYGQYYDSIKANFADPFRNGIEQTLWKQVYDNAYLAVIDQYAGEEMAAQIAKEQADAYLADAQENGIDYPVTDDAGNPVLGEDGNPMTVKVSIDEMVEGELKKNMTADQKAEVGLAGYPGDLTWNQAIDMFTNQAADGLTNGILGYWKGNQIGGMTAGELFSDGESVCMGYSKLFAQVVQLAFPKYYSKGDTSKDWWKKASNWKTADELYYTDGKLDINKAYNVDLVRITFDASVTMYGQTQEDFGSDHFWNAVKVDGKWYYIDPCYVDVYSEVMSRDRVETHGQMNHLYFMLSHTACEEMYDGYYKVIKGLYEKSATDRSYEDSWVSRIRSNTYFNGGSAYYIYDSNDLITMLQDSKDENNQMSLQEQMENIEYKLVKHDLSKKDNTNQGDSDYTALIEFNYKANDNADPVTRVRNSSGRMEENELLTKLYKQFVAEKDIYPSIALTCGMVGNKIYFNLSNAIFTYDIDTCQVQCVTEYTTVKAKRDPTVALGGMAFTVDPQGDKTVEYAPIAGLSIKPDGKLYVSIATNYAYISGKNVYDMEDNSSYGYEFQESAFNQGWNTYSQSEMDKNQEQMDQYGYTRDYNDNDEFMWTACFNDTLNPSSLSAVEYQFRNHTHNFILYQQTYYSKDDDGGWRVGAHFVCTGCGANYNADGSDEANEAVTTDTFNYTISDGEWNPDKTVYTFTTVTTNQSVSGAFDYVQDTDGWKSVRLDKACVAAAVPEVPENYDCAQGGTVTMVAEGHSSTGVPFRATTTKDITGHIFVGDWTWNDENGVTATVDNVKCAACGKTLAQLNSTEGNVTISDAAVGTVSTTNSRLNSASCTQKGTTAYYASASVTATKSTEVAGTTTQVPDEKYADTTVYVKNGDSYTEVTDHSTINAGTTVYQQTKAASTEDVYTQVDDLWITEAVKDEEGNETGESKTVLNSKYADVELYTKNEDGYTKVEDKTELNADSVVFTKSATTNDAQYEEISDFWKTSTGEGTTQTDTVVLGSVLSAAATRTENSDSGYGNYQTSTTVSAGNGYAAYANANGHGWGNVSWKWEDDHSAATASRSCSTCRASQQAKSTSVTKTETAATCEKGGSIRYTAKTNFTDKKDKAITNSASVSTSALGHNYAANPRWAIADDNKTADFFMTCTKCGGEAKVVSGNPVTVRTETPGIQFSCTDGMRVYYTETTLGENKFFATKTIYKPAETLHDYAMLEETDEDGNALFQCQICGKTVAQTNLEDCTVTLSATSYTYNGKAKKPAVTVTNKKGEDVDAQLYTVAYANNKNAGTATVTVTAVEAEENQVAPLSGSKTAKFTIKQASNSITISNVTKSYSAKAQTVALKPTQKGDATLAYSVKVDKTSNKKLKVTVDKKTGKVSIPAKFMGKVTVTIKAPKTKNYKAAADKKVTITVNPTGVTLSSVKNSASKKMTVQWKKNAVATGYQLQYSTDKNFKKSVTTKTISKNKTVSANYTKLTKGKTYYVRMRTYKTISGTKFYSGWTKAKSVKISK